MNRNGRLTWNNRDDAEGGVTAAAIEKETGTPDYWRECAEGLHATVVKLQDAEEVLRARTDRAEAEARTQRRRADDMEDNALRTQTNLRAMKERLETAETRIQAVRDILNHHGNDGPVALDALQALNNPDGSPDQPCGRGPCALGNNHTGPCRR